jgi:hypothetical protein
MPLADAVAVIAPIMHWMHMTRAQRYALVALAAWLIAGALLAGCGGAHETRPTEPPSEAPIPVPTGRGPAFDLPPHAGWLRGQPIHGSTCRARRRTAAEAHLELFARGAVVPVPAGIGIAPPMVREGAYVLSGRCSYPARTTEPTGLLELGSGRPISLGRLFEIWGQPLSMTRLADFRASQPGEVRAYLDGRRWHGDPRRLPIRPHAVIVLEVGPPIAPHAHYRFPDRA